jgi:hypothetical protein
VAFVPPKTWVDGDVVLASDTQGSVDDLRAYMAQLEASAVRSDKAWIETNHIMRGYYEPIINRAHFISGVFGGHVHTYPAGMFTYTSHYTGGVLGSSARAHVPKTTVDIEVSRPMTLFFQWWAFPFMRPDGDGSAGSTNIYIYLDDPETGSQSSSRKKFIGLDITAATSLVTGELEVPSDVSKRPLQSYMAGGFHLRTITSPGTYSMGLSTMTDSIAKTQLVAWGVSFEGFYL